MLRRGRFPERRRPVQANLEPETYSLPADRWEQHRADAELTAGLTIRDMRKAPDVTEERCKCGEPRSSSVHVERYVTGLAGHAFVPAGPQEEGTAAL